jgi:hypothetical protein
VDDARVMMSSCCVIMGLLPAVDNGWVVCPQNYSSSARHWSFDRELVARSSDVSVVYHNLIAISRKAPVNPSLSNF